MIALHFDEKIYVSLGFGGGAILGIQLWSVSLAAVELPRRLLASV